MKLSATIKGDTGKPILKCANKQLAIILKCRDDDRKTDDEVAWLQFGLTENATGRKTYFVKVRSLVDETQDFFIELPQRYSTQKN